MLHFKVKEVIMATGKKYPAAWLVKFCGFSMPKAYKIIKNKQQSIRLEDFSKLCENLNCTPNDLMYWKETKHTKLPDTHPCMTKLTQPDKYSDWDTIFKNLSPEKIMELKEHAVKQIKGE